MQFSFQRPQTSKNSSSLPSSILREKSPHQQQTVKNPIPSKQDDGLKKWQQAAEKINRDMVVQRMLHSHGQPFRLLTRIGGRTFNYQTKQTSQQQHSKTRIRVNSKERKSREILNQSRFIHQMQQADPINSGGKETRLKKKKRGENFRGNNLQRELKITNIFYENPVIKIGYNMQFQANLRFQHISQIKSDHGGTICRNSIIFFLKDAPFSPNIISQKNEKIPINVSLFPEFFDSKLSVSHQKREVYFNRMLSIMNNTYDPQRMSQMPKFSDYRSFNSQSYLKAAQQLVTMNEQDYPPDLIQGIIKKIKIKLDSFTFKIFVNEQWQFWAFTNAMSTLDYALKDPKTYKQLKVVPFLPTRIITAKKILYHGGYSKSLYTSWNNYISNGKSKLSLKLNKYHNTIQSIHAWYTEFEDLLLFQPYFIDYYQTAVRIDLFRSLQLIKIKHSVRILNQLWLRGALCLLHYKRYLQTRKHQYKSIVYYKNALANYVNEAKQRQYEFTTSDLKNNFYSTSYDNFISSLRKQNHIESFEQLLPSNIQESDSPNLHSMRVLLNIQFSNTVEQSFKALHNQIMIPKSSIIKLNLTVDRQTIKFIEQQQDIVNIFLQIVSSIFNTKLQGLNLQSNFEQKRRSANITQLVQVSLQKNVDSKVQTLEYPEIKMVKDEGYTQNKLTINYKTSFNFDNDIRQMVERVRQYYRECYVILNEFESYLPFIKLTTTQKLFGEGQGPAETVFLKNLKIIGRYKQAIVLLPKRIKINLFEVDCSVPIQTLQQRINQIEYIIQQNYINIIHEKIQSMDSELNALKIGIYDVGVNLGGDKSQEKLIELKNRMKGLKDKSKRVVEMIMFSLDNKRKMETIVNCYCQLVLKKQDLQKDLQRLFQNLEMKKPEIQAEQEAQIARVFANIDATLKTLNQTEATPFEIANLPQHLTLLKNIQSQLLNLQAGMSKWQEWAKRDSFNTNYEQKIKQFQHQKERFSLTEQFWDEFYRFTLYFKEIAKKQARKINYCEFVERMTAGEAIVEKIKTTQQQWWQGMSDKSHWKPIIHNTHEFYSKKFQTQLKTCRQMQLYLQIITNKKIKDRHWQLYNLQELKSISCRQLSRLQPNYKINQFKIMHSQVNFEYEIFLGYEQIQKKIREHHLIILDLNNSDILDLQNMMECIEFLYNVEIDIIKLREKDRKGYYKTQLAELLQITQVTQQKLRNWYEIQSKYIRYLKYHIVNEEHELLLFQNLMELHRKLVKSYDIDNSILFISKNIVMDTYLIQISGQLEQLDKKILGNLITVRQQYPRLYLLSDYQLFDFMSSSADIEHYLLRLFPHILKFHVQDGSIQKVGLKQQISFTQPLYFQQIAGRVGTWVSSLEQNIKLRMKQFYKTGVMLSEGRTPNQLQHDFYQKRPIQLSLLQRCILYTEQVLEKGLQNNMQKVLVEIQSQIEANCKQKRQVNMILLLILLREWTLILKHTQYDSFEWMKIPQFVCKGNQLQPKIVILAQQYNYAFNYLQESELIFTPVILTGNCIVGQQIYGKTSILKHYSYLCGQELLQFNVLSLISKQSPSAMLLNYFRVTISTGCWLYIKRLDRMMEQQLALLAQCMMIVNEGLEQQAQKVAINGLQNNLNKNIKIFMTISSLKDCEIPARLVQLIRPLWISPPNKRVLLSAYLQSKCVVNAETGKLLKFLSWLQYHGQLKLQLLDWIRIQQNPDTFNGSTFIRRLLDLNLFKTPQCQLMLQNLRKEDCTLGGIQYHQQHYELQSLLHKSQILVLYGPPGCGKTKSIISKLQNNFIILNRDSFVTEKEFFSYITCLQSQKHLKKKTPTIIFKNSLAYWPYIKRYLRHFRVIFIEQDLSQLHQGIIHRLKTVAYNKILNQKVQGKDSNIVQLMMQQIIPQKEMIKDIYQLINNPKSIYCKIINKLEMTLNQGPFLIQSQYQLAINFLLLLQNMMAHQYQPSISFVFSLIWSYGFSINEKIFEEILRQNSQPEQSTSRNKFVRLPNDQTGRVLSKNILEENLGSILRECLAFKSAPLNQLIPTKNGKFLSSSEVVAVQGIITECQLFNDSKINFKSALLYNLKKVRQFFPGSIFIHSKDWLTTLLKGCARSSKYCNFGVKYSCQIFKDFFSNTQKVNHIYKIANTRIIIDDLQLSKEQSLFKLKDLIQYNFAILKKDKKLQIYRTHQLIYTVGTKIDLPILQKSLQIKLNQLLTNTIFNQFVQSYCQKYFEIDCSIFSLLNLASNINRIYKRQQEQKYFWFKNPMILLFSNSASTVGNVTELIATYFDYLIQILPEQSSTLQIQKNLLQIYPNARSQKKIKDYQNVVNANDGFINQSKIVSQLLADNEILEQVQSKDIESLFFQSFVKSYFSKQILDNTKKLSKYINNHNLLILHDESAPLHRIIKYAAKLVKKNLVQYNQEENITKNSIIVFDLEHIDEQVLQNLRNTVKTGEYKHRYIIKANILLPKTKYYFQTYPFLKSRLFNIVIKQFKESSIQASNQQRQSGQSQTVIEKVESLIKQNQWNRDRELQKLIKQQNLSNRFRQQFLRVSQVVHKKQFQNLLFYRQITNEMAVTLTEIKTSLATIPNQLFQLKDRQNSIKVNRKKMKEQYNDISQKMKHWEEYEKITGDTLKYKSEEETSSLQKLIQSCQPVHNKLDKIERKIQNVQNVQFVRLKNNLKNNQNASIVLNVHSLLAFLNQKGQSVPTKDKISYIANILSSASTLASFLKNIRQRQDYNCEIQSKNYKTALNPVKIKYIMPKLQEIQTNIKKYEKVSLIYKSIIAWFSQFESFCIHLDEYFTHTQQINAKVLSQLARISEHKSYQTIQKLSEQIQHINVQAKRNSIECQQKLYFLENILQNDDKQEDSLKKLESFYDQRLQRLQKIEAVLSKSEYMKKVSSGVSLYFRDLPKIVFSKTLSRISLVQYETDQTIDAQLAKGLFTFREDIFNLKQKISVNCPLNQLQIFVDLIQKPVKNLALVQDNEGLFKSKLVELGQMRGYQVKEFKYNNYDNILQWVGNKIKQQQKIIILHENILYLQVHRPENLQKCCQFAQKLIKIQKKNKDSLIIFITNYLPQISNQFYSRATVGRIKVSKQRLFNDVCQSFEIIWNRDRDSKKKIDIQVVIRQRNSKMKSILKQIDQLSTVLKTQNWLELKSTQSIADQKGLCEQIQNEVNNLDTLESQLARLQKSNCSFYFLPSNVRSHIDKELSRYYSLYKLTQFFNVHTNNQLSTYRDLYTHWTTLLKDFHQEKLNLFTRSDYRPIINEITIKSDTEKPKIEENKMKQKQPQEDTKTVDLILSPSFRKNNNQIFNQFVQKLIKSSFWLERANLVQFGLGVASLISLNKCNFKMKEILDLLFKRPITLQLIQQNCRRVLQLNQKIQFDLTSFTPAQLQLQLKNLVNESQSPHQLEAAILLGLYYNSILDPNLANDSTFTLNFDKVLNQKGNFSSKYSFLKLAYTLKLSGQLAIRYTPPLSLSLNFQFAQSQRQRLITILQVQKCLINELVQVLKIKALSKKRELITLLVDLPKKQETFETLCNLYKGNGKYWVFLSNLAIKGRQKEMGIFLQQVLQKLYYFPVNTNFKIFLVWDCQEQSQNSFYYNKFEVSRFKGCQQITDQKFYKIINQQAIQTLVNDTQSKSRKKTRNQQDEDFQSLGRSLIQELILNTIGEDQLLPKQKLQAILIYYKKMSKKYDFFQLQDTRIFYKRLVYQLIKLGFLQDETDYNFCEFLADFFSTIPDITAEKVKKQIQAQQQLYKQGLFGTLILKNQEITQQKTIKSIFLQRINVQKIEEYFKNIGLQFGQLLRREIRQNNQFQGLSTMSKELFKIKNIPKSIACQVRQNYLRKFRTKQFTTPSLSALKQKLPLIRFLSNIKLKEICTTKKIQIINTEQFYAFIAAWQYRLVSEFMLQRENTGEVRYSSVQFGNYIHTRDYLSKMKLTLIDEQSYQQIPLVHQEITQLMVRNRKIDNRFALAVRKGPALKILELNNEQDEVDRILKKYSCVLVLDTQLMIELISK